MSRSLFVAVISVVACGGPAFAQPALGSGVAPTTSGTTEHLDTTPRLRLGHYSSADGLFGLVLDRTPAPPRAKVDGAPEILELAVRRTGPSGATLVSARGELVLVVEGGGQVTANVGVRRDLRLRRDADAEPLATPPVPPVDGPMIKALEGAVHGSCAAPIRLDLGRPAAASNRGLVHTLQRITQALENVCRDAVGQAAVQRKLRTVRVAQASETRLSLEDGVFTVQGNLEGEALGPFADEIQSFVEHRL